MADNNQSMEGDRMLAVATIGRDRLSLEVAAEMAAAPPLCHSKGVR